MKFKIAALSLALVFITGCEPNDDWNKKSPANYTPSGVTVQPMTFPSKDTVYKARGKFKERKLPQPWAQPTGKWVIYMASPGWTDNGVKIVDRLGADAAQMAHLYDALWRNGIAAQVDVAWLQYDNNPSSQYVESLDVVPDNFIPLYLKIHGPRVDWYIHSPSERYKSTSRNMRYDEWLKPYIPFAVKTSNGYTTDHALHKDAGFNDYKSEYWNSWSRHWFIVNPEGQVVDAYLSNLGRPSLHAYDRPLASIIHHLGLDASDMDLKPVPQAQFKSLYSEPFWNKLDNDFREAVNLK